VKIGIRAIRLRWKGWKKGKPFYRHETYYSSYSFIQYLAMVLFALKVSVPARSDLALLLGLLAAISISMSVPIYADAVYHEVLETQITGDTETTGKYQRPPFANLFRYVGAWSGPVAYGETLEVNDYLSNAAVNDLDLPLTLFSRYYKTTGLRLFSGDESQYEGFQQNLAFITMGTMVGLEEHIDLLDGQMPAAQTDDGGWKCL
jgi:putative ABC transport system permease protein